MIAAQLRGTVVRLAAQTGTEPEREYGDSSDADHKQRGEAIGPKHFSRPKGRRIAPGDNVATERERRADC